MHLIQLDNFPVLGREYMVIAHTPHIDDVHNGVLPGIYRILMLVDAFKQAYFNHSCNKVDYKIALCWFCMYNVTFN